jgi:sugar phosphate isomerase/epimerase
MYASLSTSALSISASFERTAELAELGGFSGIDTEIAFLTDEVNTHGISAVKQSLLSRNLKPGACVLPWQMWEEDEAVFEKLADELPQQAKIAAEVGYSRSFIWVMPFSETRDFEANGIFHRERIARVHQILSDCGIRMGLEFIGPETLRKGKKHAFIHTLGQTMEFIRQTGLANLGILLDSFHLYTSLGTVEEVAALSHQDIVHVHLNDGLQVAMEEQIDNQRELPGATGVFDLAGMLHALEQIGYEGPVTVEPFCSRLDALTEEERVRATGDSLTKLLPTTPLPAER